MSAAGDQRPKVRKKNMTTLNESETLSSEEKFVALPLQTAIDAAEADLLHLDGSELVAEAA